MKEWAYNREKAVAYASQWALFSNPAYYHYGGIGGDCTNFVSQCVYAGAGVMNYAKDFGWYYTNANDKAPAWTGVPYFWNFMTANGDAGPYGISVPLSELMPGDVVQLSFDGEKFSHSLFVLAADYPQSAGEIRVAAHSTPALNRLLSTYNYSTARYLHMLGVRGG